MTLLRACLPICLVLLPVLPAGAASVSVDWSEPEGYADVRYQGRQDREYRTRVLGDLEVFLAEQAKERLPEGYTLKLVVTDVDLAGEFESWRGPALDGVRVVKDIYPARVSFTYELKDVSGAAVATGEEYLHSGFRLGRMRYERETAPIVRELLEDWVRRLGRQLP